MKHETQSDILTTSPVDPDLLVFRERLRGLDLTTTKLRALYRRAFAEAAAILREAEIETADLDVDSDAVMEYWIRTEIAGLLEHQIDGITSKIKVPR